MIRWCGLLALACAIPPLASSAQDSVRAAPSATVSLTLDEAFRQARSNSPTYRQSLNDASPARWGVRNAYGSLLPSFTASTDLGYTGSGQANFGSGFTRLTSSFVTSGYSLGLEWQLSGRSLTAPAQQKALQRATDEDISGAGVTLLAEVSIQYLDALQAAAQVGVATQQVRRNQDFLNLAQARYRVGQATLLDVRQAEVTKGSSDLDLLRAQLAENEAKLELLRRMGVEPPVPVDQIMLADSFPVVAPAFRIDSLLALAERSNPVLRSSRAREHAAGLDVRAAKADFLPSLSLQAGWSGFTQEFTNEDVLLSQALVEGQALAADCLYNNSVRSALSLGGEAPNCHTAAGLADGGSALLDPAARQIRTQNNVFPFHYTGQLFRANLVVSLPIFAGLGRSLRLSQAASPTG